MKFISAHTQRLYQRIKLAGEQGVPALTSIDDARAIDTLREDDLVRWTGTRWVATVLDDERDQ